MENYLTPTILTPITYDIVRNAPRPEQTESYMPVTHGELIDFIREKMDVKNYKIVNERYSTNKNGAQMFGEMAIEANDSDMRMAIGFRNSLDKSLPVGFVAGTQVIVCSNLMLSGDIKQVRRHTLNISKDLTEKFSFIEERLDTTFKGIKQDVDRFKGIELPYEKAAELFGKILMRDSNVATVQQATKAIDLFKNPLHDFGNTDMWGFYNAFTEAFKEAHPWRAPQNYLNLHKFVKREFNMN
jgi:hypothetical protein